MSKFKFTRRERIILMILGILLVLRLIATLIIFRVIRQENSNVE